MLQAIGAYLLWGLFPFYFPLLKPAGPVEILAHRFVWTCVLMAIVVTIIGGWRRIRAMSRKTFLVVAAAAVFISVNWGVYVYAVNTNQVAEAALGYFINPLVSVALGVVFLKETLTRLQTVSVLLATIAVIILTISIGTPPIIALSLAFSFGFYGLLKKQVNLSSAESLMAESAIITPLAIAYLVWLQTKGTSTFLSEGPSHMGLLMFAGVATALPLLLFGIGAKKIPLSTIGLIQYITPCMQMIIAVVINKEQLEPARWVGYIIIWVAVVLFVADILISMRKRRKLRAEELT